MLSGKEDPTIHGNGTVSYSEEASADDLVGARALSLTTFASTLELVAMNLGLGAVERVFALPSAPCQSSTSPSCCAQRKSPSFRAPSEG